MSRASGVITEVDVTARGLDEGLQLATTRQIRLALIVGEEEQRRGVVTVRDLVTGEEQVSESETFAYRVQDKEQAL